MINPPRKCAAITLPAVLCLFLSVAVSAAAPADTVLSGLSRALERAWCDGDTLWIRSLRSASDSLAALPAYRNNWRIHYCRGYCAAFYGRRLQERDGKRTEQSLREAVSLLTTADTLGGGAPVLALLADCAGNLMRHVSVFGAIAQAKRAGDYLERALRADSLDPRTALVDGVSRIYRPSAFGGGANRARERLYRAIELRRAYTRIDSLTPDWGAEAEIWAWLALVEAREGNSKLAREYAGIALRLQPGYWFVPERVQPEIEKVLREK